MTQHTETAPLPQPFDESFAKDPYAVYERLRAIGSVHRVALPDGLAVWLVTHEHDVRTGLLDARLSVNKRHSTTGFSGFSLPPALDRNLLNIDPDDHVRLRRLVAKGFTPRHVEMLREDIQSAVDGLIDGLVDRISGSGEADLVAGFAKPLPLRVVGALLDVPAEDQDRFSGWVAGMLAPRTREELVTAIGSIHRFLVDLVAERRARPGEDMLSSLIAARDDEDRLTEDELVSLAFLILMAGSENVQHVISNGVLALLSHPDQLASLRAHPDLLPEAVEELLRYAQPIQTTIRRFPTEPVEIAGVPVPAGDTVLLCLASAHRDPARYPEPDRFDINRADKAHLALGHGMHYCLGAPLARLQLTLAFGTLLDRLRGIRLARPVEDLPWTTTFRSHALRALPVTADV
ncbi:MULTISPECIES: cytochrome P450 [unclassified Streptomyces]|uniref:cytochrome P450 family protein n=1 Tax=unclassified Streptomyces TaxID=2593676 RepID=UPI001BE55BA8|nr:MULTISPECIES: cytochrome P450 [unclassified Streptomyces]MBT2406835.1 cytochrome P450 [Streptomyces sp. ISL-21]MBT2455577.1 cytochrome P450 [Streptomyces sp. ISL-86]MBT2613524.1 cytochrome P450 [Streptomyces sp. ISL-87]